MDAIKLYELISSKLNYDGYLDALWDWLFLPQLNFNENKAIKGVEDLYAFWEYDKPMVLIAQSPLACQVLAHSLPESVRGETIDPDYPLFGIPAKGLIIKNNKLIQTSYSCSIEYDNYNLNTGKGSNNENWFNKEAWNVSWNFNELQSPIIDSFLNEDDYVHGNLPEIKRIIKDVIISSLRPLVSFTDKRWDRLNKYKNGIQQEALFTLHPILQQDGLELIDKMSRQPYNVWNFIEASIEKSLAGIMANLEEIIDHNLQLLDKQAGSFPFCKATVNGHWLVSSTLNYLLHDIKKPIAGVNFFHFLQSGIFEMLTFEKLCIVCKPPVHIHRNEHGELHNASTAAVAFADGYQQYYIFGKRLPAWIWEKAARNEITRDIFLKEENLEIRAAIYEVLGPEKMLQLLNATITDQQTITHLNGDEETITLFHTQTMFSTNKINQFAWIKVTCPSTDRQYLLNVDPVYKNAKNALASLSRFTADEYQFNLRS